MLIKKQLAEKISRDIAEFLSLKNLTAGEDECLVLKNEIQDIVLEHLKPYSLAPKIAIVESEDDLIGISY